MVLVIFGYSLVWPRHLMTISETFKIISARPSEPALIRIHLRTNIALQRLGLNRTSLVVLVLLLECLSSGIFCQKETQTLENKPVVELQPANQNLPKLIKFEVIKKFFNKKYQSLVEDLTRRKIFLTKAFRAFLSTIDHKNHKQPSYLAINHLSDRTNAELKSTLMSASQPAKADTGNDNDDDDDDDDGNEEFFDAEPICSMLRMMTVTSFTTPKTNYLMIKSNSIRN